MMTDITIIGGGVVGLSIAHGLLKSGLNVTVIDGSDTDFRASRGNFGLVWVQSKGLNHPEYAKWTQQAVSLYPDFVSRLEREASTAISYQRTGGYEYFLNEESLEERAKQFSDLRDKLSGNYPFEVFDQQRIRDEEPNIGPRVVGATYYPDDGHINPLQLLHALLISCKAMGLNHITGVHLSGFNYNGDSFALKLTDGREINTKRVVLAAGLGAKKLGPMFGFRGLVQPQRGQVLVSEKLPRVLNRPSLTLRQVNEGAIQIGDSKEDVGFDDHQTLDVTARIAAKATAIMPSLSNVRLVRSWGALRVMSPDGLPIYQASSKFPGATLVTCHSGISLAAAHSELLPRWILGSDDSPNLDYFGEKRFD